PGGRGGCVAPSPQRLPCWLWPADRRPRGQRLGRRGGRRACGAGGRRLSGAAWPGSPPGGVARHPEYAGPGVQLMSDRILLVDDEQHVLAGYERQLRKAFAVDTAVSGDLGLATLASRGPYAVIVSDMRMPGLSGAQFLARARQEAPESVRMLL